MSQMSSLEELSQHLQRRGFRAIGSGETREHYCREFGQWLAPQLVFSPALDEAMYMSPVTRQQVIEAVTESKEDKE
jgi:hypothetical protein